MERDRSQQRGISWTASRGAGRIRQWWVQREMAAIRARHKTKRRQLAVEQERLNRVRQEYREHDELRKRGRMFRLHSAEHHLACSERRFARLFASQLVFPVLVTRRSGRKWWWYLDRFWWDDEGLRARDVETIVLQSDLRARQQADALLYARASVLGDGPAFRPESSIPELRLRGRLAPAPRPLRRLRLRPQCRLRANRAGVDGWIRPAEECRASMQVMPRSLCPQRGAQEGEQSANRSHAVLSRRARDGMSTAALLQ